MTRQELFNRITSNLTAYNRLQYRLKLEVDRIAPHYVTDLWLALGEVVEANKKLLAEYSQMDMVIFRSTSGNYFWLTAEQFKTWQESENEICQRLLNDGTWQSEEERWRQNLKTFSKVSG